MGRMAPTPAVFVRDDMFLWRTTEHENEAVLDDLLDESTGLKPIFIAVENKGDKSTQRTGMEVRPIGRRRKSKRGESKS